MSRPSLWCVGLLALLAGLTAADWLRRDRPNSGDDVKLGVYGDASPSRDETTTSSHGAAPAVDDQAPTSSSF